MKHYYCLIYFCLALITEVECEPHKHVFELDERFTEASKQGDWLVMFYAPWCGHCRRLEPVYEEVAQTLAGSNIVVSRMDATRFPAVASNFGLRGYPTLLFINGETNYTHEGDRSKEDIIQFAKRAHGPAVRSVASPGRWAEARAQRAHDVFFLYVGPRNDDLPLWKEYAASAESLKVQSFFYAAEDNSVLSKEEQLENTPAVAVFKDDTSVRFPQGIALESWVRAERFSRFPRVAGASLNEYSSLGKLLVILAVASDKQTSSALKEQHDSIRSSIQSFVTENYDEYHKEYQFLWMPELEVAHNIMMLASADDSPVLLVLESDTGLFYVPAARDTPCFEQPVECLRQLLLDHRDGKAQALGGRGIVQRLKRVAYDIITTIMGVFHESALLGSLIFGLPTVIITFVCYMLCTASDEPLAEEELDSDDELTPDELTPDEYTPEVGETSDTSPDEQEALYGAGEPHLKRE